MKIVMAVYFQIRYFKSYLITFYRKVTVYKNLDSSMMDMLALLCNEEASNSLKTADFYKVKVMRRHLTYKFNGIFSLEYQNYIYMIFNAMVGTQLRFITRQSHMLLVRI